MGAYVALLLIMTCLGNQLAVASRSTDMDSSMLTLDNTDDVCRCHKTTFRCKKNIGLFSSTWWSVPLGFCDPDLQTKREEFEFAMQHTDTPTEWNAAVEVQVSLLKRKMDLFEESVKSRIGTNVDGTVLIDTPTKEKFEKMSMGQQVFIKFGGQLSQAKAVLDNGKTLSADKREEIRLTTQLEEAIKGMSIEALEDAMREANQATVAVPWSVIVRAQTRQDELKNLAAKLLQVGAKTDKGKQDLYEAVAKLNEVKKEMEEIQTIQDDLGERMQEFLDQEGALTADDEIRDRLAAMQRELQIEDSEVKMNSLKSTAAATVSKIGAH